MKYYLISGEASGDLHGSHLIKALKKVDPKATFRVWGGDLMEREGAFLVKHYRELAFMGFWEVFLHLPSILNNIALCKKDIINYNPDVIIYIDYPGFNLRIAEWAKKKRFKNHYYISPQVWAWKENRVYKMKKNLDALYVILPFEKNFFENEHQFSVHYVGHPLLDYIPKHPKNNSFCQDHEIESGKPIIALLPGSRIQEINKMLPLFVRVEKYFSGHQFVIAGAPGISRDQYNVFTNSTSMKIVYNSTYDLLQHSTAALVTSGTATLETALFGVPQLVCYRSSTLSYWIAKRIIKLKFISLVNLILNRSAVIELIQDSLTEENLRHHLKDLLKTSSIKKIEKEYLALKTILGKGGASSKTAQLIFDKVKESPLKI